MILDRIAAAMTIQSLRGASWSALREARCHGFGNFSSNPSVTAIWTSGSARHWVQVYLCSRKFYHVLLQTFVRVCRHSVGPVVREQEPPEDFRNAVGDQVESDVNECCCDSSHRSYTGTRMDLATVVSENRIDSVLILLSAWNEVIRWRSHSFYPPLHRRSFSDCVCDYSRIGTRENESCVKTLHSACRGFPGALVCASVPFRFEVTWVCALEH